MLRSIGLAAYRRAAAAGVPLLARRPHWDCLILPLSDEGRIVDRLLVLTTRLEEAIGAPGVTFLPLDPAGIPLHLSMAALIEEAESWVAAVPA